ncbi:MAG: hypothetical protein HDS07_02560 [Bacteroides sp.]|nr:hypothetical protein [Bacteroides sp.]
MNNIVKLIAFVLLSMGSVHLQAKTLESIPVFTTDSVKNARFRILPGLRDEARTEPRLDLNGKLCALIKVATADSTGLEFSGNIVGDISYRKGTYYVYVTDGTRMLQMRKGNDIYNFNLSSMLFRQRVVSGRTYVLCGFDNDGSLTGISEVESINPALSAQIRECVRQHINAFESRDSTYFIKMYNNKDLSDNKINGELLDILIKGFKSGEKKYRLSGTSSVFTGTVKNVYGVLFGISADEKDGNVEPIGYAFMLWDARNHPDHGEIEVATLQTLDDAVKNGIIWLESFDLE